MYQPKTGAKCTCKRGIARDNCSTCEGTGWVIDFRAIRARVAKLVQVVKTEGVDLDRMLARVNEKDQDDGD